MPESTFLSFLSFLPLPFLSIGFFYSVFIEESDVLRITIYSPLSCRATSHAETPVILRFRIQKLDELVPLISSAHTRIAFLPLAFMHSTARFTQPVQWSMITESVVMTFSLPYRDRSTSRRI